MPHSLGDFAISEQVHKSGSDEVAVPLSCLLHMEPQNKFAYILQSNSVQVVVLPYEKRAFGHSNVL